MRRFIPLAVMQLAGCSTHPVADFLDVVKPAPAFCRPTAPVAPAIPAYPAAAPVTSPPAPVPELPQAPPPSWPTG